MSRVWRWAGMAGEPTWIADLLLAVIATGLCVLVAAGRWP